MYLHAQTNNKVLGLFLACGLITACIPNLVRAENTLPFSFIDSPNLTQITPVKSKTEPSIVNRMLAIGVGAIGGAITYSIATRDWGWALGLWSLTVATTDVVGSWLGITGAARTVGTRAAATTATRAAAAAVPRAAATATRIGAAKTAARVVKAAAKVTIWTRIVAASRIVFVTASALTGAFIANAIYGKD